MSGVTSLIFEETEVLSSQPIVTSVKVESITIMNLEIAA
jgi:hypothetical protein